jgi:hypothetical protein
MKKYFSIKEISKTRKLDNYMVDWEHLLSGVEKINIDDHEYLVQMRRFTNIESEEGSPGGILAYTFTYGTNTEFERLINDLKLPRPLQHLNRLLLPQFIASLLAKTDMYNIFSGYCDSREALYKNIIETIEQSQKIHRPDFLIASSLGDYLYNYGMLEHFYEFHKEGDAVRIALDFTNEIFENNADNVFGFDFMGLWNGWFDMYSCTDRTFLMINKIERKIWLLLFSDSD